MSRHRSTNGLEKITIRIAEDADFASLSEFFAKHFPSGTPQRDPLRRHYLFHEGPCDAWIARTAAGTVVAHVAALPVAIDVAGNEYKSAWIFNIIVARESRHQGIASGMVQQIQSHYGTAAVLGANANSRGLLRALGWVQPPDVPRYVLIADPNYYLRRAFIQRRPKEVLRDLAIAAQRVGQKARSRPSTQDLTIERLERFDNSIDTLYSRLAPSFRLIARRNCDLLNWRFVDRPKFKMCLLQAHRGSKLEGYIVFGAMSRDGERIGAVADWLYDLRKLEVGEALIEGCIDILSSADVHRIEAWVFPDPMRRILRSHGFRKWPKGRLWLIDGLLSSALNNAKDARFEWHLTLGDANLDEEVFLVGFAEAEDYAILDVASGMQKLRAD